MSQLFNNHRFIAALAVAAWVNLFGSASALADETCGGEYVVQSGDSLSLIAQRTYDDVQKWTTIYNVNRRIIGEDPNLIQIGQYLRLPCLESSASDPLPAAEDSEGIAAPEPAEPVQAAAPPINNGRNDAVRFLTGGDYPPFTDKGLPNDGLITDIVVTALERDPDNPPLEVAWVDDWSLHLNELLLNHEYDMGFPWFKPDCESTPDEFRCANYLFSNPVFEMLILLYTHRDRPLVFNSDTDIEGSTLCRPRGYFTHDLEKGGRLWLTNNLIQLEQPATIEDCFDLLVDGQVDAVALNEFTGRSAISRLDLSSEVVALEGKPLSVEGLRVVIHKEHPRARELMAVFNQSMTQLQLSDDYSPIIDRHFRHYWMNID